MVTRSIRWSSHRVYKNWDAISVAASRILCQRTDSPRFACCGRPNLVLSRWFSTPRCCFQQPPELSHTSLRCCFHQPPLRGSCSFLSWEHIAGFWSLFNASFLVPPNTDSESSRGFPETLEASELKEEGCIAFRKLLEIRQVGLGFDTASSSPVFLSWILFDIVFAFSIERKWLRETIEKFLMLNKRWKLHHSSREKLPLVSMSASWDFGSKSFLSNNQSTATLWVRDTCLIVGLRPLIIILIAASLSSKKCTAALHVEKKLRLWSRRCGNLSTFWLPFFLSVMFNMCKEFLASLNPLLFPNSWSDDFLWFDEWNASITTSHKSRAGIPSTRKPASNEIISDSVELCDTDVCFLHIQLMGTHVPLPTLMLIWDLQGLQQNLSLETVPICNVELYYPHDIIIDSYLCDECRKSDEPSVCHKL